MGRTAVGRDLLRFIINGGEALNQCQGGDSTAVEILTAEFIHCIHGRLSYLLNILEMYVVRMIHDHTIARNRKGVKIPLILLLPHQPAAPLAELGAVPPNPHSTAS